MPKERSASEGPDQSYNSRFVDHRMIRIQFTLSQKDLWEPERAKRGWQLKVLPFSGGFLILWGIYMLLEDPGKFGLAMGAVLVGVFVGFGIRLAGFYSCRRDKRLHDKFVATFSEGRDAFRRKSRGRVFGREFET